MKRKRGTIPACPCGRSAATPAHLTQCQRVLPAVNVLARTRPNSQLLAPTIPGRPASAEQLVLVSPSPLEGRRPGGAARAMRA